ncbi:hypothetical protein IJ425_06795, partial [bacterium]|nr:hypothetical protein [bacterium]
MVEKKKKRAFSMVDAIIILTAVGVAICVATPVLTRKAVNIAGPGPMYSAGHGRYEVYYKELVSYDGGGTYWEKAIEEANNDTEKNITVYVRQTDSEYEKINKRVPKLNTANGK